MATEFEKKQLDRILREQIRRECEALRLYEPMPHQEAMHSSKTQTIVMRKGNQCGGEQPLESCIFTPTGKTTLGELKPGDVILGGDGLPCVVEAVQEYGDSPCYRFTFSDGTSCEAGENHKWTCHMGRRLDRPKSASVNEPGWRVHTTEEIVSWTKERGYRHGTARGSGHYRVCFPSATAQFTERDVPVDPYTLGVLIGDGNFTHRAITITSADDEVISGVVLPAGCRMRKLANKSTTPERYGRASVYSISGIRWRCNPMADALRSLGLHGKRGHEKHIPECYIHNSVGVRLSILQGLMDTDGTCGTGGGAAFFTSSESLVRDVSELVKSLGGRVSVDWRENSHKGKDGRPLAHMCIVLPAGLNPFRLARKRERWASRRSKYRNFRYLEGIEYVGGKPCRCIKVSNESLTYLTDDYIVTHNTLAGAVEVARAVTNSDPHKKYPESGIVACLGYGEKHIGKTFYPKLFRSGAFDIIKDLGTGKWRTYRPWPMADGGDLERDSEKKPAPPLIPQRFVKEIAWEKRSERIFSVVRLTTGWELWAFNSAGDPGQAQGFQCKLYWVDEDLATAGWISEILFRLLKQEGYLRWTALPHGKNDEMLSLLDEWEKQQTEPEKTVEVITAATYDNKYIEPEKLAKTIKTARAMGEDVYRQRILGELSLESIYMYPTFNRRIHDVANVKPHSTEAQKILAEREGEPPEDWTRYASIDPGHNVLAIMFLAVPPEELGDQVFIYDECYIRQATHRSFGEAMQRKCSGQVFESFIIDIHGGRLSSVASGEMPVDKYADALSELGIAPQTGRPFIHGEDDRARRENEMRNMLAVGRDENPRLMVCAARCPNFCHEMERFKKKTIKYGGKDVPLDEGNRKVNTHTIEAVEQAIAIDLKWVPRRSSAVRRAVDWFTDWAKRNKNRQAMADRLLQGGGWGRINLGPRGDG
jgi:hypothetical protein